VVVVQFASLEKDLEVTNAQASRSLAELRKCKAMLRHLEGEKRAAEGERDRAREELLELRGEVSHAREGEQRSQAAVASIKKRFEGAVRARDAALSRLKGAEEKLTEAESSTGGLRRRAATAETQRVEITSLRAKLAVSRLVRCCSVERLSSARAECRGPRCPPLGGERGSAGPYGGAGEGAAGTLAEAEARGLGCRGGRGE
jgi:chromosome segregation ATPase